jgi:mannitol 2-dehydrogenase
MTDPSPPARDPGSAAIPLSNANLPSLAIQVPGYDRSQVVAGIAHIGVGGFHRAHQAMYVDRLLTDGAPDSRRWGICGIGVLPHDAHMRDALAAQDHLYTLVLRHPDGTQEARVIGSIVDYLLAPDDPRAVIDRLSDPAIRIVSLTVTEGGYNIDNDTGSFDIDHPDVRHDVAEPEVPTTVFGLVVSALERRRAAGIPPFTVVSCDNIQSNGDVARAAFSAFAELRDPELGAFVGQQVAFPNSMVDRITPATTDADRTDVARRFGVADAWPVVCEPFTQWVLEDRFGDGRPAYEDAGVQLVGDVAPYERMKLRLLNAGHQGVAYFGRLAGHTYVHDAMADEVFAPFLLAYMHREAVPTLGDIPGVDLSAYCDELIERFSNPHVADTTARLAFDGSERIPKFLLPVVRDRLRTGDDVRLSAAIVASFALYCEGSDEAGSPITIDDQRASSLSTAATRQADDPLAFVRQRELFGDLAGESSFTTPYLRALESLRSKGSRATMRDLLT